MNIIGEKINITINLNGDIDFNSSNVKAVKCYLKNNTNKVGRFRKVFGTPFRRRAVHNRDCRCLNYCGRQQYHVAPYQVYGRWFDGYHMWPCYNGFGVISKKFAHCHNVIKYDNCCLHNNIPAYKVHNYFNNGVKYFEAEIGNNAASCILDTTGMSSGQYLLFVDVQVYEDNGISKVIRNYTCDCGIVLSLTKGEAGTDINTITCSAILEKNVPFVHEHQEHNHCFDIDDCCCESIDDCGIDEIIDLIN